MTRCLALLLAVVLTALGLGAPVPALAAPAGARPRIALVLSGGGARGAAHIGVLQVLETLRVPVDIVVGTSMGALVGGGYAAGVTPTELHRRIGGIRWETLLDDEPPRQDWPARRKQQSANPTWDFTLGVRQGQLRFPKGAIAGQEVESFFNDLVKGAERVQSFDDLPIPFRAVATDLENGELKVFDRAPLPVAMRASMSVPTLFAPVAWEGRLYVDGGLVRNLPVDVARDLGAEVIIAVNLGSGHLARDQLADIFGVFDQMIAILTEKNVRESLTQLNLGRDVLIVPQLGDIGSEDFGRVGEAVGTGVAAAQRVRAQLARYSLDEAQYAAWRRARFGPGQPVRQVGEVRVTGLELVNPEVFKGLVAGQRGRPLDRARLAADIQRLYGHGDFERIGYRFQPQRDGGDLLIVDAVEKSWGPGYLRFGLGLSEDFRGDSRFGLRATYDRTWINRLGAAWGTELTLGNAPALYSEFYQPLSLDRLAFVAPYLDLNLRPESVFLGNRRVARYEVTRGRIGADLGTTLAGLELRTGAYVGRTLVALDTGWPGLPEGRLADSGVRARLLFDTLDDPDLPHSGGRLSVELLNPLKAMGADLQYTRALVQADASHTLGPHTFSVKLKAGTSFGSEMPYYDQFPMGGFLNLSGYANDQFRGNRTAFGALIYHRRIAALPPPLGRGLYLGASLEAGWLSAGEFYDPETRQTLILNPAASAFGGSLFLGSDTWIGPAYLAFGLTGSGHSTVYAIIGRP